MDDFEQFLKNQPLRTVPPEWRADILAEARKPSRPAAPRSWLHVWLWPSPYAWGALAAMWMAVFILNSAAKPGRSLTPGNEPAASVDEMVALWNERRRSTDEFFPKEKVVATTPAPAMKAVSPGACLFPRKAEQSQIA